MHGIAADHHLPTQASTGNGVEGDSDAARCVAIKNLPWACSSESHFYQLARVAHPPALARHTSQQYARQCRL